MKKMLVFASLVLAACGGAKEEAAPAADTAAMAAPAPAPAADSAAMAAPATTDSVVAGDTAKKM